MFTPRLLPTRSPLRRLTALRRGALLGCLLLQAAVVTSSGCASTSEKKTYVPLERPPAPRTDDVVFQPRDGQVWIEGKFVRVDEQWVWSPGQYVPARQGQVYRQGRWEEQDEGWVYVEGEWTPIKDGHVWVRGFWKPSENRRYVWVPGQWRPTPFGQAWVRGHWSSEGPQPRWVEGHWRQVRGAGAKGSTPDAADGDTAPADPTSGSDDGSAPPPDDDDEPADPPRARPPGA